MQSLNLDFIWELGVCLTFKKSGLDRNSKRYFFGIIWFWKQIPLIWRQHHFRGKRNESAYIHQIAEKLASVKETSVEEVAKVTSKKCG